MKANHPTNTIGRFRLALEKIQNVSDMTVGAAISLLTVCMYEGRSLREYADLLSLPHSTMSRHLLDLGIRDRHRRPGLMLIDQQTDPDDSRRNVYKCTAKGKALIGDIIKAIGGE